MADDTVVLQPPRGMRDFYPEEMTLRNAVFDAWRHAAARHGFAPYDACVVESLALLKRKAGEEIENQLYTFADKSGRDLALRAEMTPTLARMVAARQGALSFPLKWYAIAQCFRYERMTRGRKREHYQWNLDIIGEASVAAEAEVVATALRALAGLGLTAADVGVYVSSRALLADLFATFDIGEEHHPALFLALDKRGKLDDAAIRNMLADAGLDAGLVDAAMSVLALDSLDAVRAALGRETPAWCELAHFFELCTHHGIADSVAFDISIIRGLGYYTGIVFEAFDRQRKFRAVFGGGRYDNLLADIGGRPATGVGLGFGDVVVNELMADRKLAATDQAAARTLAGFMEEAQHAAAIAVATRLRNEGVAVDLALRPQKARQFFNAADKGGYSHAVFIGPDDIAAGIVRIKDLKTREEREEPVAE